MYAASLQDSVTSVALTKLSQDNSRLLKFGNFKHAEKGFLWFVQA